jgi:hypothetical protein
MAPSQGIVAQLLCQSWHRLASPRLNLQVKGRMCLAQDARQRYFSAASAGSRTVARPARQVTQGVVTGADGGGPVRHVSATRPGRRRKVLVAVALAGFALASVAAATRAAAVPGPDAPSALPFGVDGLWTDNGTEAYVMTAVNTTIFVEMRHPGRQIFDVEGQWNEGVPFAANIGRGPDNLISVDVNGAAPGGSVPGSW